jgi:primosomal protein N' (replication factor Y)
LAQVAGRAGRGEKTGCVLVQSYQPEHPAVRAARDHDYQNFYRQEIRARQELGYPPFSRMVAVRIDAGDEAQARRVARRLADVAARQREVCERTVDVLGPAPAPISRLRGRYRFRLMLRSADRRALRKVAASIAARIDQGISPARAVLDVDPVSML